jgi:ABC-2 type transport system permease protein
MLMDREVSCVVTIPGNFSESISSMINETVLSVIFSYLGETMIIDNETDLNLTQNEYSFLPRVDKNATSQVIIEGDTGYINFGIVQPIIHGILNDYLQGIRTQSTEMTLATLPEGPVELTGESDFKFVSVQVKGVSGTEEFTIYDHQAPGIVVFALLLLSINVAVTLAREVETKKLTRLKISKMNSFDLLMGTLIPWAVIAAIQVLLLFGVAVAMGFHWQGGTTGIGLAIIIGTIAGFSSISLGLIVASFSKSEKHASNLGTIIAVPVSFLVGSFFEVPTSLFTEALPWGQAIDGLRSVLTFGQGMEDVLPTILILSIETVILFVIGVIAFSRTQLKAE